MAGERGRPRAFDEDAALDEALALFWRLGFQGASLAELTQAMGLSKPSLYAAFGDKEALYLRALERYVQGRVADKVAALAAEPDGFKAVQGFLRGMARMFTEAEQKGCFVVNGLSDLGGTGVPAAVEQALAAAHKDIERALRERLLRAQQEGGLAAGAEVRPLASFFATFLAGLGVSAKAGGRRAQLEAAIEGAMRSWPMPG